MVLSNCVTPEILPLRIRLGTKPIRLFAYGSVVGTGHLIWKQVLIHLTAAESPYIDVMLVQEFQPKVAQRHWLIEDGVLLMVVASAGDDRGEVVARVIG